MLERQPRAEADVAGGQAQVEWVERGLTGKAAERVLPVARGGDAGFQHLYPFFSDSKSPPSARNTS